MEHLRRTPEDIEALKKSWVDDPCWDIECTDGFEAHYDELLAYSQEKHAECAGQRRKQEERENERLLNRAEELGIPGAIEVVRSMERCENQLRAFEQRVADLREEIAHGFAELRKMCR